MINSFFEADSLSAGDLYRLLSGTVCPRPIAWVSTRDRLGNDNLAPFSFFNVVSVNPPVLGFSPLLNGESAPKDTLANIVDTGECVVNISGEALVEKLNATALNASSDVDEYKYAGLNKAAMPNLSVPRVSEAPVAFGCRLYDIINFGDQPLSGNLVLVNVVSVYIENGLWNGRHVNVEKLQPLGRMAGHDYARTSDLFELERP